MNSPPAPNRIMVFGATEYPCVFIFGNDVFATSGVIFDLPESVRKDEAIEGQDAIWLHALLTRKGTKEELGYELGTIAQAPSGMRVAISRDLELCPMVIASVPPSVAESITTEKRRIIERASNVQYLQFAREQAWSAVFRRVVLHGVPNINKNIVAVCTKAESKALTDVDVATIRNSSSQLRSIILAEKVLAPNWKPDQSRCSWQQIHVQITRHTAMFKKDIGNKRLLFSLGQCHDHILMAEQDLDAVLFNVVGNCVKYAQPGSAISVGFMVDHDRQRYRITFSTTSAAIYPDEVSQLMRLGFRGRRAMQYTKDGQGLGFAIAHRVLFGYGGNLLVHPGPVVGTHVEFAENRIDIEFPASMMRLEK